MTWKFAYPGDGEAMKIEEIVGVGLAVLYREIDRNMGHYHVIKVSLKSDALWEGSLIELFLDQREEPRGLSLQDWARILEVSGVSLYEIALSGCSGDDLIGWLIDMVVSTNRGRLLQKCFSIGLQDALVKMKSASELVGIKLEPLSDGPGA